MKKIVVIDDTTPEEWMAKTDNAILACRGQGHAWPKLRAGRPRRGIAISPGGDGVYQITFTCPDCKTTER